MPDEEAPVIWRGPVVANMVKQFWSEVIWGELDFLLVDMPPGTGDVPLTVFQSLPLDGVVIVTSPAGAGTDDRKESIQYGDDHAHSSTWSGRKLQLSEMSGLRKRDQSLWRKPTLTRSQRSWEFPVLERCPLIRYWQIWQTRENLSAPAIRH